MEVPLLISASQDDERVPFAGVCKWLQQVRSCSQGREDVVMLTHPQGGHFGYQADMVTTIAKEHTFLSQCLVL